MAADNLHKTTYALPSNYEDHRAQQKVFKTTGGNIAYLDYGKGPTLVLLHGVPSSSWLYRKMIEPLQSQYRVIAIDLLGFGSSDKPESNGQNYLVVQQSAYVSQLLNHLKVKDYNLLFHDMGGLVAWDLVSNNIAQNGKEPKVNNLIVLNTIIDKHGFKHPKVKKGVLTRLMSDAFSNQISSAAALEKTFENMGLTSNMKLSENECNGYVIPMQEGNGDVLYDFYTSFDEAQFTRLENQVGSLVQFNGNVLVLWGAEDDVLTTEQIPILQKVANISDKNIHIFNNHAHFIPEEIPAELVQKIKAFLN